MHVSRTNQPPTTGFYPIALTMALTLSAVVLAGGCWSKGKTGPQSLTADRFKAETPGSAGIEVAHYPGMANQPAAPDTPALPSATSRQMGQDLDKVTVIVGPPPVANPQGSAAKVGPDILADAMVGQINGRPVFANEILGPLNAEMATKAKRIKSRQDVSTWLDDSAKVIRGRLITRVQDELQVAEARAHLPPELREQGLLPLLNSINAYLVSQSEGSLEKARENVARSTEGRSLEEEIAVQRDKYLIQKLQEDMVEPKVRVPWRKVERFYKDNEQALFNPSSKATVRTLMVSQQNTDAVAKARAAAAGPIDGFKAFTETEANVWPKDKQSRSVSLDKPFDQNEFFGNKTWNEAVWKLHPGEVAGPFENGPFLIWIGRDMDETPPSMTLEEAQLGIYAYLTRVKRDAEINEFFQQLFGKSSFTPINRMMTEILLIAADRHLPSELAQSIRAEVNLKPLEPTMQRSPAPSAPTPTPEPTPVPATPPNK